MVSSDCSIDFGNMILPPWQSEVAKVANLRERESESTKPNLRARRPRSQLRAAASCDRNRGIKFHASFGSGELLANCRVVKVANRYGECVRCVVWFGYSFQ